MAAGHGASMEADDLQPGPAPQLPQEAFAKRRARAAEQLGDDQILVVATHQEALHSNDVHHRFRPHSDFWYLTGFAEPEAALVIEGDSGHTTMFLRHRKPEAEIWTGRRLGVDHAAETLGVDRALAWDDLTKELPRLTGGHDVLAVAGHEPTVAAVIGDHGTEGHTFLAEMRVRKDADELRLMREAARVGNAAMMDALCLAQPGTSEATIEAALIAHYRRSGSTGPGYPPIVGAGGNAAILHYIENKDTIQQGDLLLVDAGCEWGYYNSDITRTVPAGGLWSDEQRRIYDLVEAAQKAAIATVRPGARLKDPHDAAVRVLTEGLVELGWLEGDVEALIADDEHRRFYMHGTSHFLGLDVHDAGAYKQGEESRLLEPGMVITVEPGIYANPDFTRLPAGVAPFGIRLENDIIVTEDGHEDLQADLPTDADAWTEILG